MTMIKTWRERCEEHPDHEGIVTERMIHSRMQEEIDELRQAIEQAETREWIGLTDEEIAREFYKFEAASAWYQFACAIEAKLKEKNLIAAGSQAFYGFPTEPVSTPNAGGKCVTAGETAPTKLEST